MAKAEQTPTPKPQHKASYARDKQTGRWNVRVTGPHANRFAGRTIPVTKNNDNEPSMETLVAVLWSGPDKDPQSGEPTGKMAAIYSFEPKPKDEQADEIPF